MTLETIHLQGHQYQIMQVI